MVIDLSAMGVARTFGFISASLFLAIMILWPVNDQPVSKTQKLLYLFLEFVLFMWIFGFFRINIVP
jgi:hypothetical protein